MSVALYLKNIFYRLLEIKSVLSYNSPEKEFFSFLCIYWNVKTKHRVSKCKRPCNLPIKTALLFYAINHLLSFGFLHILCLSSCSEDYPQLSKMPRASWNLPFEALHVIHWQPWRGYSCTAHCSFFPETHLTLKTPKDWLICFLLRLLLQY